MLRICAYFDDTSVVQDIWLAELPRVGEKVFLAHQWHEVLDVEHWSQICNVPMDPKDKVWTRLILGKGNDIQVE